MNHNSNTIIATATAGIALAGFAYFYSQRSEETGRGPWNEKKDVYDYDYVILGGGTAGCVLAARLAEDPNVSVLIIEAGEDMDNSIQVKMPIAVSSMYGSKHDWQLKSIPQVHANGREIELVRGKILGGCSSINGSLYTRGPHSTFDQWATTFGNPGWSYEEVLPYFKKSECFIDPKLDSNHPRGTKTSRVYYPEIDTFQEDLHGIDGPWPVSFQNYFPFTKGFVKASMDEGIPRLLDPSASPTLGVCRMQSNIQADAARSSTSRAFLGPKTVPGGGSRGKIRIILKSKVERILIEDQNGVKKTIGAEFRDERDVLRRVHAKREVLLCAGVFHSPVLLLASGIGYKIHDSIPLVHPLKGVGENLVDPITTSIVYRAPDHIETIHKALSLKNIIPELYKYFRHGTGALCTGMVESVCFLRLEDIAPEFVAREKANGTWQECASGPDAPHLEIMFLPSFINKYGDPPVAPKEGNYYSLMLVLLNPASKGRASAHVSEVSIGDKGEKRLRVEPLLDTNYLGNDFDMRAMREILRFARKLGKRMQQDPDMAGAECFPGEKVVPSDDDAALEAYIRQECFSAKHPMGTCPMGPSSNPEAVVDARLKVHGIDALRVVDASIFPRSLSGHTAAATVMVAEKASDMIKEDWKLKQQ
ncbi:hypothetical protein BGZ49_010240 [Haplosporangium sp. Z 27]|nr:hypothetical protein BGZ49_010240 [Haplosporangium sp. Z 27]